MNLVFNFFKGLDDLSSWKTTVIDMWKAGILMPEPIDQELKPIYTIFEENAVKNIVHSKQVRIE